MCWSAQPQMMHFRPGFGTHGLDRWYHRGKALCFTNPHLPIQHSKHKAGPQRPGDGLIQHQTVTEMNEGRVLPSQPNFSYKGARQQTLPLGFVSHRGSVVYYLSLYFKYKSRAWTECAQ
jgi:hypothetical protein